MTLKEQISNVVEARYKAFPEFENMSIDVSRWKVWTDEILSFQREPEWTSILEDGNSVQEWKAIETLALELQAHLKELEDCDNKGCLVEARKRANRKYLNIGSVGPWRNGKSQLLSKLIGQEDKWIIPVSPMGEACTGTTINFFNTLCQKDEEAEANVAVIYCYTVREICEKINLYIDQLHIEGLHVDGEIIDTPEKLNQFCNEHLQDIRQKVVNGGEEEEYKKTLLRYFEHIDDYYMELTGKTMMISELLSEESKRIYYSYVSFRESPDSNNNCFKVLATKKAEIYISFEISGEDVGMIQVVDTPGIGEKRIGVNEALSEALRKELDIAIAVYAIKEAKPYAEANDFNKILKIELNGREPKKWLFYLFNNYSAQTEKIPDLVDNTRKEVIDNLSNSIMVDGRNIPGIKLDESHVKVIDCKLNEEYCGFGEKGNPNGISRFFIHILQQMVPSIEDVDKCFYNEARAKYKEAMADRERLMKLTSKLTLLPYSTHDIIEDRIHNIHRALSAYRAKDIKNDITNNVDELASEEKGIQLVELYLGNESKKEDVNLKLKNRRSESELEENEIDDIVEYLTEIIDSVENVNLKELTYKGISEFQFYSSKKNELLIQFEKKIAACVDNGKADKIIENTKEDIWSIFIDKGGLSFISDKPSLWYLCFIVKIKSKGNQYPMLCKLFTDFGEFHLDVKTKIESFLETVGKLCFHQDDFGGDGFTTLETARKSFMYSFYCIESVVKDYIKSDAKVNDIEGIIAGCNDEFHARITDFSKLTNVNSEDDCKNIYRSELYTFYEENMSVIFENDVSEKKRISVNKWKELISKQKL